MTISNPTASTAAYIVWIASVNATNGATNNTVKNCNIVGNAPTTTFVGLVSSGSALGGVAEAANTNTTFQNNSITASQYAVAMVGPNGNENGNSITGNSIGSTVAASKIGFNGIAVFQQASATVSNNTIQGVNTATTSTASAIRVAGTANGISINANNISDVKNTNATGFGANGIQLNSSVTTANVTVSNNFISDVTGVGFNGVAIGDNGYGIIAVTGGGYNIYFNSISLTTDQTASGSITAALNITSGITTAGSIDLRDNILSNQETVGTRYAVYNASTVGAAVFSTINYNDYFAQNVGFQGTAQPTLTDWQTATGQDANSKAVDPLFVSATNLHIQTGSPMVDMGTPIAGITTDFDGNMRGAMPDIGADELFVAMPGSLQFGSATYNANENAPMVTLTVTRTGGSDGAVTVGYTLGGGTATGGATCGAGIDYVNTGGTVSFANGETSKTFDVALCDDTTFEGDETFIATLANATGGATIGMPSSSTVTILENDPMPTGGTINVGTGQTFTSLTNPGGVFEAINTSGATSNITINVTSDLTAETGAVALNEIAGGFSVTIRPSGAARTISGSSTATALIRINDADNVTIDGSLSGAVSNVVGGNPAIRNLTVQNTSTAAGTAVIAALQGTNGAQNFTIKNVNVSGQDPTLTLIGIHIGGNANGTSPTVSNNNSRIENCSVQKAILGIFNNGATATPATGTVITMNDLSATGANRLRRSAIFLL